MKLAELAQLAKVANLAKLTELPKLAKFEKVAKLAARATPPFLGKSFMARDDDAHVFAGVVVYQC